MAGVAGNLGRLHLSHTVDGYLEGRACGFTDETGRTLPGLIAVECFRGGSEEYFPFVIFNFSFSI